MANREGRNHFVQRIDAKQYYLDAIFGPMYSCISEDTFGFGDRCV